MRPYQIGIIPLLLLSFAAISNIRAVDGDARERIPLNANWRFQKGDPANVGDQLSYSKLKDWLLPTSNAFRTEKAETPSGRPPGEDVAYAQPQFDDQNWRTVNLPHDWGIEGPFDQELPGETGKLPWFGVAWYRQAFDIPASDEGKQISLEIDGAMSYATVWCNGKFVGGWPYGYASWHVDLTPFINFGGENVLAIRIDNPKDSSRWYPGGGIYRNVWLVKTAPVHIGQWGTSITTPQISRNSATVNIEVRLENSSPEKTNVQVLTEVFQLVTKDGAPTLVPTGKSEASSATIDPGDSATVTQSVTVGNPKLWSPSAPNLYVARTRVAQDDRLIDSSETAFGIRTAEFVANDGFHLNGERIPLQGVCMHHDLGALGAAFNERAAERQLEILKEMGVNAIRTAHNPPAPELLDLCDRMGFLVIDEFTDTWTVPKKPNGYARLFPDWHEADLRAMVRRDRNHPSIILWSTGNEIGEQRDPTKHPVSAELSAIVRDEDPTRPTTAGCDFPDSGRNGFQKTVDVFGYNYKPHEYSRFHDANPNEPLYGSETSSCISSRGEYAFPVSDDKADGLIGFQMSSYDLYAPRWAMPPDWEFKGQDENPFVAGEFVWTGFDYIGEPTPFNNDLTILTNYHTPEDRAKAEEELKALGKIRVPSRSSYFGIVDLAGFKKDRFYLYQSRWQPELPMAHILPHWNWPDRVGEITPVHVYTSGDEAELFLNDRSLGRKRKDRLEYRLRWDDVKYEPGELKVVAYKNGKEWAEDVVRTTGPAFQLQLTADRPSIATDGRDLAFVTATVADKDGSMVPDSNPDLSFTISGPGEIIATDNGDPTDLNAFPSPDRSAFNGLALAIVRAIPGKAGPITVRVAGDGLTPATLTLNESNQQH